MYVRVLSKHSYGCYMLQLLPDGVREKQCGCFFIGTLHTLLLNPERDPVIDLKCKIYQFMPLLTPATKQSQVRQI